MRICIEIIFFKKRCTPKLRGRKIYSYHKNIFRYPEFVSGSFCRHDYVCDLMKRVIWDFSATLRFGRNDTEYCLKYMIRYWIYQLPVTSYQLPVTSYQLPVTSLSCRPIFDQQPDPDAKSSTTKNKDKNLGANLAKYLNKALDLTHVPHFCGFLG